MEAGEGRFSAFTARNLRDRSWNFRWSFPPCWDYNSESNGLSAALDSANDLQLRARCLEFARARTNAAPIWIPARAKPQAENL